MTKQKLADADRQICAFHKYDEIYNTVKAKLLLYSLFKT